jgi:hypothetical protein
MKAICCVLVLLCVVTVTAQEQETKKTPRVIPAPASYYKAEKLIDWTKLIARCTPADSWTDSLQAPFLPPMMVTVANLVSYTKEMDAKQITAIITKYVKDHPETWHLRTTKSAFTLSIRVVLSLSRPSHDFTLHDPYFVQMAAKRSWPATL